MGSSRAWKAVTGKETLHTYDIHGQSQVDQSSSGEGDSALSVGRSLVE